MAKLCHWFYQLGRDEYGDVHRNGTRQKAPFLVGFSHISPVFILVILWLSHASAALPDRPGHMESVRLEPFAHLSSLSVNCTDECLNQKEGKVMVEVENWENPFNIGRLHVLAGKVFATNINFFQGGHRSLDRHRCFLLG